MEATGLALGAIPIILKGIDIYIELYGEWSKSTNILAKRRRQLQIEHLKLTKSLEELSPGLVDEEVHSAITKSYPNDYETILATIGDLVESIQKLRDELRIDPQGKPMKSSRVHDEWRRIKRSFKKKETNELFDEIYRYNRNLSICFEGRREISSDLNNTQSSSRDYSFNKGACQKVRSNACLIHETLSDAYDQECAHAHVNLIDLSWYTQGIQTLQIPDMSFPIRDSCAEVPHHWHTARIRLEPKQPSASVEKGNFAKTLLPTETICDRKLHKARFDMPIRTSGRSPSQMPSVTTASPSREEIHSICSYPTNKLFSGYFINHDQENQKMIILERKRPASKGLRILSWRSLLTSAGSAPAMGRRVSRRKKMSKKDRLAIASAATWVVLLLCGTPWLEETRMMENDIVLLTEDDFANNNGGEDLDGVNAVPAFSYQFRTPVPSTTSHDGNNHADSLEDGVAGVPVPHRTLFALGILLLEIGLDIEFRDLYEQSVGGNAGDCWDSREETLIESYEVANDAAEELYDEVGDAYADAVKRCLKFNFPGRKSLQRFDNEMLRQHFFTGVVAPVHERYEQEQTRHRVFRAG